MLSSIMAVQLALNQCRPGSNPGGATYLEERLYVLGVAGPRVNLSDKQAALRMFRALLGEK